MFESHISAGATEKLPGWEKLHAKTMAWSHDMEGHAQKSGWKCTANWRKKKNRATLHIFQSLLGWSPIQEGRFGISWRTVGSLLTNCFLKCLFLARIGRPYIPCSVNKLAPSATKWTQACDKRLASMISYIHHTRDYRHCCHAGNAAQHCRLGLFQVSDGDFEHSNNQHQDESYVYSDVVHVFLFVGSRHQYLTVPQNREITSLDAGLRTDGLPALDLWDVVMDVLRSTNNATTLTKPGFGNRYETWDCSFNPSKTKP